MKDAVHHFSKQRAEESKALVQISRELDRPGVLGLFTFVFPLILDSIFNKMAPQIFSPNTIAMLQKSENTFRGLRRRKRFDRLGQFATIGAFATAIKIVSTKLIRLLSRVTGKRNITVLAALVGSVAAVVLVKKMAVFLVPGLAPADVLNKAKGGSSAIKEEDAPLQKISAFDNENEDLAANMSGGGI